MLPPPPMVPSVPVPDVPDATPEVPEDVPDRAPTDRKVVKVSLIPDRALPKPSEEVLVLGVGSTQPVLLPTVEGVPCTGGTAGAAAGAAGLTPAGPKSLPPGWFWVFAFKTAGGIG